MLRCMTTTIHLQRCQRTIRKLACTYVSQRPFSAATVASSGHSRWSKIKHDKAKADDVRNKHRSALAQELTAVSKSGGGDPSYNPRLNTAITNAKKAGFQKQSIENAIARGQGLSPSGAALESFMIEFMMPTSAVAGLIECATDNKNRSRSDINAILKDCDATQAPTAFMFDRRGKVFFRADAGVKFDALFELAVNTGAIDVISEQDGFIVYTEPSEVVAVAGRLEAVLRIQPTVELTWTAKDDAKVKIENAEMEGRLQMLVSKLEDDTSVQDIYLNAI